MSICIRTIIRVLKPCIPSLLLEKLQQKKGEARTKKIGHQQAVVCNSFLDNFDVTQPHQLAFARYYLAYHHKVLRGHFLQRRQLSYYFRCTQELQNLPQNARYFLRSSNIALLPLQESSAATAAFLQQKIGPKGRNMLRKAEKYGYYIQPIEYDRHLNAIYQINISKAQRQGRAMTAAYQNPPEQRSGPLRQMGIAYLSFGCFAKAPTHTHTRIRRAMLW